MPCNGLRHRPSASSVSSSRARARARSSVNVIKELSRPSKRPIRSTYAPTRSRGDSAPERISREASLMLRSVGSEAWAKERRLSASTAAAALHVMNSRRLTAALDISSPRVLMFRIGRPPDSQMCPLRAMPSLGWNGWNSPIIRPRATGSSRCGGKNRTLLASQRRAHGAPREDRDHRPTIGLARVQVGIDVLEVGAGAAHRAGARVHGRLASDQRLFHCG